MTSVEATSSGDAPVQAGPFWTNWGPRDGLILYRDDPPALGVFPSSAPGGLPIGAAFVIGHIPSRKGPAAVFRLVVGKGELEGSWICRGRQFVRLGEAAEEV